MEETRHTSKEAANEEAAKKRVKAVQARMLRQPYFTSFQQGYFSILFIKLGEIFGKAGQRQMAMMLGRLDKG